MIVLTVLSECKTEKRNSKCEQEACFTRATQINSMFEAYYVFHEAMNGCKKSRDSLKACLENVNIVECS